MIFRNLASNKALRVWGGAALACLILAISVLVPSGTPSTAALINLGSASGFTVLAGSAVTNEGDTSIRGNVGVSPGPSVAGFPPGQVSNGGVHESDALATQAQTSLTRAYFDMASVPPTSTLLGNLGGQTLSQGVHVGTAITLDGVLTLDGGGDSNSIFIFKAASLAMGSTSSVTLINEANPCNVFWYVTGEVTIGPDSVVAGSVVALSAISLGAGTELQGRVLSVSGGVSLNSNDIDNVCDATPPTTGTTSVTTTTSTTEPSTTTSTATTSTTNPSTTTTTATTSTTDPPTTTTVPTTTSTSEPTSTTTAIPAEVAGITVVRRPPTLAKGPTTTRPSSVVAAIAQPTTTTTVATTTTTESALTMTSKGVGGSAMAAGPGGDSSSPELLRTSDSGWQAWRLPIAGIAAAALAILLFLLWRQRLHGNHASDV